MSNVLDILGSLGGPITAAINAPLTMGLTAWNAKLNNKYWNQQAEKSYELNEQSANNAMQRSIDMYNMLQSPSAMVKQLREAGLNPALMYSKGGMGGNVTNGPQGGTNGGSGAPTLGLQHFIDPLTKAQIENINADTDKKREEVKNVEQDTALKKSTELLNSQTHDHNQQRFEHELGLLIASEAIAQNEVDTIPTKNEMTNKQLEILENEAKLKKYEEELASRFKEKGWDLGSMTGLGSLFIQMGDKLLNLLDKWNIKLPEWMLP